MNLNSAPLHSTKQTDGDQEWRKQVLQLLSDGHTFGGMDELSFEVADTHYSVMFTSSPSRPGTH